MKSILLTFPTLLCMALALSGCQSHERKPLTKAQICHRISQQLHINQMQNGAHPGQPLQRASLLDDYKSHGCGPQSTKQKTH